MEPSFGSNRSVNPFVRVSSAQVHKGSAGTYHYKSSSGQEGEWFSVGFASRKAAITVYLGLELDGLAEKLGKLGTHKTGEGCIYIRRLADVDLAVLEELVAEAYVHIRRTHR